MDAEDQRAKPLPTLPVASVAKAFFAQLSEAATELVLDNLMSVQRIDTHVGWILAYIAGGHAAAVWRFLGRRILQDQRRRDSEGQYEAIPYQFHELPKVLSQDAASAVRVTRSLYTPDDTLFQFRGARLLGAMFPTFPENLARELTIFAATGTDDDVGFILQVLRAYQGQQTTHEVVKELIARLQEDDPRLQIAEMPSEYRRGGWRVRVRRSVSNEKSANRGMGNRCPAASEELR